MRRVLTDYVIYLLINNTVKYVTNRIGMLYIYIALVYKFLLN